MLKSLNSLGSVRARPYVAAVAEAVTVSSVMALGQAPALAYELGVPAAMLFGFTLVRQVMRAPVNANGDAFERSGPR